MKKQRTKFQKYNDLYDAFKCAQQGIPLKRSRAKDGSISTRPIVEVEPVPEREVLIRCLAWLKKRRILCWRHDCGTFKNERGKWGTYGMKYAGDIIGLLPDGCHFEIETKSGKGGRLSEGQQKRMRDIIQRNGVYLVIHGVDELEYHFGRYV